MNRQIELLHHAADNLQLLPVFFSEHCDIGLHKVEKLQHHRAYAVKKSRSERTFQLVGDRRRLHAIQLRHRIHFVLARREQHVDAALLELDAVGFERTRIPIEILVGAELQPIDEDAGDDAIAVAARDFHQRHMPGVQVTHCRHKCNALRLREAIAQRVRRLDDDHPFPLIFGPFKNSAQAQETTPHARPRRRRRARLQHCRDRS